MSEDKKDFFEDLLDEFDEPKEEKKELSEEEQRRKNKDAEEARKRREAEAKAEEEKKKAEEEAKAKQEVEKKEQEKVEAKVDEPAKPEPPKQEPKVERTNRLGEQLVKFKEKYPEVDLSTLDKDANFKRFINGKLLGRQNFIELYDDYIELKSSLSGSNQDDLKKNYTKKAKASSGTSKPSGKAQGVAEVYSKEELERLTARMPLMGDREVKRIQEKFNRSVDYYKNNK
jgi:hypothetical protein